MAFSQVMTMALSQISYFKSMLLVYTWLILVILYYLLFCFF